MTNSRSKTISSPCIRNCCLDTHDICLGCFRSLSEITQWTKVDDKTRKIFLNRANQRKSQKNKDKKHVKNT